MTILDGKATITLTDDGDAAFTIFDNGEADINILIDGIPYSPEAIEAQGEFGVFMEKIVGYPNYTGPMVVTPTQGTQVLPTELTTVLGDIVVNPIPQNYGLITWNGSVLTVS